MVGFGGTDPSEGDRPALYGPETMAAPNARAAAAGRGKDGKGTGDQDSDGNASHEAASYQRAVRGSRTGETVFVSPHEEDLIDEYFRTLDTEEASHVP